jgi:hypothetical protein
MGYFGRGSGGVLGRAGDLQGTWTISLSRLATMELEQLGVQSAQLPLP